MAYSDPVSTPLNPIDQQLLTRRQGATPAGQWGPQTNKINFPGQPPPPVVPPPGPGQFPEPGSPDTGPYPTPTGAPTAIPPAGKSVDPSVVSQYVAYWAGQPGSNPSMKADPNYWIKRITETGGIGAENDQYWQGMFKRLEGAPEGGSGGGGGNFTPPSVNFTPSAGWGNLEQKLMELYGQNPIPDANDPIIRNQVDAYGAKQTRANRDYLSQLAETKGASANLGLEERQAAEGAGQATGAFEAQLMGQELTARRGQIMQALQMYASVLSQEDQMKLQAELAQINNALQYAYLGQNAYQFDANRTDKIAGF